MKKIASIIFIIIAVVLIGATCLYPGKTTGGEERKPEAQGEAQTRKKSTEYKPSNTKLGDTATKQIESSKIVPMHTPVIIRDEIQGGTAGTKDYEYCVDDAYYSRKLPEQYAPKEVYTEYFGSEVMNEDGTLLKDWYYVVVNLTVKNAGQTVLEFIPKSVAVIFIDDAGVATDNTKLDKNAYYYRELGDAGRFNEMRYIPDFQPGETCRYQMVYIVQEQEVTKEDVYIRANYGMYGERALGNPSQRYIKLEMEER